MALQSNDLFVVQSQTDKKLYSLKTSDLEFFIEGSSGIQFRGSADLNNGGAAQTPPIDFGALQNGDLYIVESDAAVINSDWIMETGVTSANENDRVIWDSADNNWVLVSGGSSTGGLIQTITATTPLESDGDAINPVLSIKEAATDAPGAVARLATAADVVHTTGTGDSEAVVTADLLKATNEIVEGLSVAAGGVTTVTTTDANGNSALTVSPTSGNVVIEIETADDNTYGVVQIASDSDIQNGTSGGAAVIDASQLKDAIDNLPQTALNSITEGGTDIVSGALQIATDADNDVTIGVNEETFVPYDFSSLTDINA